MIRVEHYPRIENTQAVPLAVWGWAELIGKQHCGRSVLLEEDDEAVVAYDGEDPVGVITFDHRPVPKKLCIGIGYVRPSARRAGVYRHLWAHLVQIAQERGAETITSEVHAENEAMRAAARAQGRRETYVTMVYDVPPEGDL